MKTNKRKVRKAVWIAIVSVVVLIASGVAVGVAGASNSKRDYGDRTEILKSASDNPTKALVVYQPSITAATSDVAHAIARGLNDSGYEVTLNTPGSHLSEDISQYSVVVFGTPNYGGVPAETLTEYMKKVGDFTGKRVILFSTSGVAEGRLEHEKMTALLDGVKPYAVVKFAFTETENNKAAAYQIGKDAAGI